VPTFLLVRAVEVEAAAARLAIWNLPTLRCPGRRDIFPHGFLVREGVAGLVDEGHLDRLAHHVAESGFPLAMSLNSVDLPAPLGR
jgi:hypothetical protein